MNIFVKQRTFRLATSTYALGRSEYRERAGAMKKVERSNETVQGMNEQRTWATCSASTALAASAQASIFKPITPPTMMAAYAEPEFDIDFASEELTSLTAEQQEQQRRADPMNTGFMWYTPPLAAHQNESGGEQWIISGHDMQVLMMTVPTGRTVVTEVGSFFFGSAGTRTDVEFTCCSEGEGCKRICGGESCVKLLLTNDSPQSGYVGLTPGFPAKVIPLKVRTT